MPSRAIEVAQWNIAAGTACRWVRARSKIVKDGAAALLWEGFEGRSSGPAGSRREWDANGTTKHAAPVVVYRNYTVSGVTGGYIPARHER